MDNKIEGWLKVAEEGISKVLADGEGLDITDVADIEAAVGEIETRITEYERFRVKLGRVLDYNALKQKGFPSDQLCEFEREDREYVAKVDEYYRRNLQRRRYMFGYPANMEDYSYTTS